MPAVQALPTPSTGARRSGPDRPELVKPYLGPLLNPWTRVAFKDGAQRVRILFVKRPKAEMGWYCCDGVKPTERDCTQALSFHSPLPGLESILDVKSQKRASGFRIKVHLREWSDVTAAKVDPPQHRVHAVMVSFTQVSISCFPRPYARPGWAGRNSATSVW